MVKIFVAFITATSRWIHNLFLVIGQLLVVVKDRGVRVPPISLTSDICQDLSATTIIVGTQDGISFTHATLGKYNESVGIITRHSNELDAWRESKKINSSGGKVKVVTLVNGELSDKDEINKRQLFYERLYKEK